MYGVWRLWAAWQAGVEQTAAVASSGIAMSLAAAVVLDYYLIYWNVVRVRLRRSGV